MEPKYPVLNPGQKTVAAAIPPRHAAFCRVQAQPARSEHDVSFSILDHLAKSGDDGGVVLPVGVQHDDDVGAHLERVPVARLLVASVTQVLFMSNAVFCLRKRDAEG